jgi:predicted membrane protein
MAHNQYSRDRIRKRGGGHNGLIIGLLVLGFGTMMLLKQMSIDLPFYLFKWELWLVLFGLAIGIKNKFRDFGWLILCFIGIFLLADDLWPDLPVRKFMWPVGIIIIGIIIITSHRYSRKRNAQPAPLPAETPAEGEIIDFEEALKQSGDKPPYHPSNFSSATTAPDEILDVVAVFGSTQRIVYSKNFSGGEVVCVFGGADINLSQADFTTDEIVVEVVTIFGGATLYLPPTWNVRTETSVIFGGVEDKRRLYTGNNTKTLVLKGAAIFGGIEIKNMKEARP